MPETLQSHLKNLHRLYSETVLENPQDIRDFVWTVAKQLSQHVNDIDALTCRQLLADCIKLPVERPSTLYSALLTAAVKVAAVYPEFRFEAFAKMWGLEHLRPEDRLQQMSRDGKTFPSLSARTAKALGNSLLLHPKQGQTATMPDDVANTAPLTDFLLSEGYEVHPMLVTRIKEAMGKDGRKYRFITLTSPQGIEVESISNKLQVSPLHPLPEGRRHYVNIGQIYNCLLHLKTEPSPSYTLVSAILSDTDRTKIFLTETGYIEHIDPQNGQMHIYDRFSRHFVAHVLRFSQERVGDFVRFIPIIPLTSKFKTAIICGKIPVPEAQPDGLIRNIRITAVNTERHYASWELIDKSFPITEQLSSLQLSLGETSTSFTTGFLSLTDDNRLPAAVSNPQLSPSELAMGQTMSAIVYLKRGKDRQKRPHIAQIL